MRPFHALRGAMPVGAARADVEALAERHEDGAAALALAAALVELAEPSAAAIARLIAQDLRVRAIALRARAGGADLR